MYCNTYEWLHEDWLICHDPENIGRDAEWQRGIPEKDAKPCVVPSFAHQTFCYDHGIFWYQKKFKTQLRPNENEVLILRIGSADFLCETYLNGVRVGLHRGTENPFQYDVTALIRPEEENLLVFRVSKPFAQEVDGYNFWQIPHRNQRPDVIWPGHCQNECGISGNVELSLQPKLRVADLYLVGNVETSAVDVTYTIHSDYEETVSATVLTRVSVKRTGELCNLEQTEVALEKGDTTFKISVPIADVCLWSTDDPFLYLIGAEIRATLPGQSEPTCVHTLTRHTGFRVFEVKPDGFFYLNGKRIFLRCSHSGNCFPYSTHTIPHTPDLVRRDLYMAKASGLNMVRFISGACLPDQLDYADEIGLMIYEEPVASWLTENGPYSEELYKYDLVTMLQRDRSHPSLCIWGLLNETTDAPPFNECCRHARGMLPLVREYDASRLVLYSSGRFDGDSSIGSVANPGSTEWECLWNREGKISDIAPWRPTNPGGFFENVGDVHIYPRYPISKFDRNLIRTIGSDVKRPVFLSEHGTGSLFDTVWLTKLFEQEGVDKNLPDVRQVYHMNECLMRDLKTYGFEEEYAFPQGMMQESQRLHSRQRALNFDMVRSNPYMNGYSITGLLDHSICGEGLWTIMREWKIGCVDAMQNGFAKLKWCMFFDDMHFYAGQPVRFEAVLANEDQLVEKDYPVCFRILGEDGVVWEKKTVLHPTKEDLELFAIPVLDEMITLDVPSGTYEMFADIEGAAAMDYKLRFYVTNKADITATVKEIVAVCINENTRKLLAESGVAVKELADVNVKEPAVVLVDWAPDEQREAIFEKVNAMAENGSRVFLANRHMLYGPDGNTHYLAIENKPYITGAADWLYHQEYLAKRRNPYFKGLPKGIMDWEYWLHLVNGMHFKGGQVPAITAAASFGTGCINDDGYLGGVNIGTYPKGKGAVTVNSYDLVENIGVNPAADRLLLNILSAEAERLEKQ